jgi:hypothetical protein
MSKVRKSRSENGSVSAGSSGSTIRRSPNRKTFIERLLAKADSMVSTGTELAQMLQDRIAPSGIHDKALEFVPVLEKYREMFFALRDSGWVPPEKAPMKDFKEGDRVAIVKAHLPRYDFISGLAEGVTKLEVAKFVPRGEGAKYVDVLVKDAVTGATYGLVPKSQLVGA